MYVGQAVADNRLFSPDKISNNRRLKSGTELKNTGNSRTKADWRIIEIGRPLSSNINNVLRSTTGKNVGIFLDKKHAILIPWYGLEVSPRVRSSGKSGWLLQGRPQERQPKPRWRRTSKKLRNFDSPHSYLATCNGDQSLPHTCCKHWKKQRCITYHSVMTKYVLSGKFVICDSIFNKYE